MKTRLKRSVFLAGFVLSLLVACAFAVIAYLQESGIPGGIAAACFLILACYFVALEMRRRNRATLELSDANIRLQKRQQESSRELDESKRQLEREMLERRQAEESLREGTRETIEILENTKDTFIGLDYNWRFTYLNAEARRRGGAKLSPYETIGRKIWDIFPDLRGTPFAGALSEAAMTKAPVHLEMATLLGDAWYDISIYPLKASISIFARDVTQRHHAEQRLRAQHAVTKILSDARSFEEAAPKVLMALCECVSARVGELWRPDEEGETLSCSALWVHPMSTSLGTFVSEARNLHLAKGEGLAGRVWSDGKPISIPERDVACDFPRLQAAKSAGIKSCFAFPLHVAEEFFGVVQIFAMFALKPDELFIQMLDAVGQDWAQFIRRRSAEAEVQRLNRDVERRLTELQTLMDVIPVGVAVAHDPQCSRITGNKVFAELMGIDPADELSLTSKQREKPVITVSRDGRGLPVDALPMRLASSQGMNVHGVECEITTNDGQQFSQLLSASPLFDETGAPRGSICAIVDITSMKKAEEALRESEERFRQVANIVPSFVWRLRPDGSVEYMNDQWYEYTGMTPGESLDFGWRKALHPDDVQRSIQIWKEVRDIGKMFDIEVRFRRIDGEYRWFITRAMPRRESTGKVSAWYGSGTDVHDHKMAELALRENEERLRLAMSAGDVGVWDWDIVNDRIAWSDKIYEIHGVAPADFGHKMADFTKLIHPDESERVRECIKLSIEERKPYSIDFRIVRPDGEVRWVSTTAEALYDPQGRAIRMLGATVDATERKRAEAVLARQAFYDTLTGLPNRLLFMERLDHAIARSQRHDRYTFAVLFLDLDQFKLINDSLGHLAGDQLLVTIGKRIQDCLRPDDTVARMGGDEFTVLLEDIDSPEYPSAIASRILKEVVQPLNLMEQQISISASIGIALGPAEGKTSDDYLRSSDTALYRAKALGKSRYEVYVEASRNGN